MFSLPTRKCLFFLAKFRECGEGVQQKKLHDIQKFLWHLFSISVFVGTFTKL